MTLRSCFRPLRSQHVLPTLRLALAAINRRDPEHFRVIHHSVQYDHLHLIVEAQDEVALSSGMRSLAIRIARSVNALVGRRGPFWADRWHGRALTSPRQMRTALVYVMANFRKHARQPLPPGIDAYSSGAWFDGWQSRPRQEGELVAARGGGMALAQGPPHVLRPETWLGQVGWRRYGLLRFDEAPAGAPRLAP